MNNTLKFATAILLFTLSFSLTSCDKDKHKVRKNIDGDWKVTNVTSNGNPLYDSVEGTYSFGDCSRKNNRKADCRLNIELTITLDGEGGTSSSSTTYKVLKNGNKVLLDDSEFEIDLQGDAMILTNRDGGETLVIELGR